MLFKGMTDAFKKRFKLSNNLTLANYKFRKIEQAQDEGFDSYVIRVKREAVNCDFKCELPECTVADTLIRDQIIFGTTDDEIRKQAGMEPE